MLACPSIFCSTRIFPPFITKCEANVWRRACNHVPADKADEIAVNFYHFEEIANTYRQRLPFTLSEIKKLLKSGRDREFIRTVSVRSSVSDRYNTGKSKEMRKPVFFHCWIFKKMR
jgi:hypothetical protein